MKKTVRRAIALAFVAAMMLSTATVFAAVKPPADAPNYTYVSDISADIWVSGGKVRASGQIVGKSGTTSCSVTVTIQKKVGTSWVNVTSSTANGTSYAEASASATAVPGTTYRAKAAGSVNRGKITENATAYSGTVTP